MFFCLDDRIESRENFVSLSEMSNWSVWDLSPWFPNVGKALLYNLSKCMMGLVSG